MAAQFEISFSEGVKDDIKELRAYDRRMILDAIEAQLTHAPNVTTHQRQLVRNLAPPFEAIPPIWQLRVGTFRIFYDVDEQDRQVYVRAIRKKPVHRTTEEIL